ncbi:MAG: hypothetical protein CMB97_01530 [Flavobacteriaceae bacterium]|nr:hypothetical protein [Flavobacteriaceae bacterium]
MAETDPDFSPSELSEDQSLSEAEGMNDVLRVKTVNAPYQNEPSALGPQGDHSCLDYRALIRPYTLFVNNHYSCVSALNYFTSSFKSVCHPPRFTGP